MNATSYWLSQFVTIFMVIQTALTAGGRTGVVVGPPPASVTWYVRVDGGSINTVNQPTGQCDGKHDAAYPGSGTNQPCAVNDFRWLYDDQTFPGTRVWSIHGGDDVIIRGCASGPTSTAPECRIGSDLQAGSSWCPGVGNAGCFNPAIPAGTSSKHTTIKGANFASCASDSAKQVMFGGWGVGVTLSMSDAQYVDFACINLTRHSDCIFFGTPAVPAACNRSFPTEDDEADNGMNENINTANVTLTDMWIHGFLSRGIIGPIGGLVTATRVVIDTNGGAGWDFADDSGDPMGAGADWHFINSTIKWNGCNQEYPFVDPIPVASCYSQGSGGYGDGVGSPTGTGLSATAVNSTFIYNTQDALDLGHVDTGGPYTGIFNLNFFAHNGGSNSPKFDHKFGTLLAQAQAIGNIMIGDGARMASPITGVTTLFNANLGDFCRAGDTFPYNFDTVSGAIVANNTIIHYCPTTIDNSCNAGGGCSAATSQFYNNIILGYAYFGNPCAPSCPPGFANYPTQDYGGTNIGPTLFFYQNGGPGVRDYQNNIYYQTRQTCPTGFDNGICVSPQLVVQPTTNQGSFVDTQLDVYGTNTPNQMALSLLSSSPGVAGGISYAQAPTIDIFGTPAPGTLPIGAVYSIGRTAASISASDILTQQTASSPGDIILVPGGTTTWSTLNITKAITLACTGTCTITDTSAAFKYSCPTGTTFGRLTGFSFTGVGSGNNGDAEIDGPATGDCGYRMDHNNFTNTGQLIGIAVIQASANPIYSRFLLDHNNFTGGPASEMVHELGYGSGNTFGWGTDLMPGDIHATYLESNVFTSTPATCSNAYSSAIQGYYGSRTAFRYNHLNFSQVDQHGTAGSIYARWWELIGNAYEIPINSHQAGFSAIRGGTGVQLNEIQIGDNTSCSDPPPNFEMTEDRVVGTYPLIYQVGRGINGTTASPAYLWNLGGIGVFNGNTAYLQSATTAGGCGTHHPCDYIVSTTSVVGLTKTQSASDISLGGLVLYSYNPLVYPHPFDN